MPKFTNNILSVRRGRFNERGPKNEDIIIDYIDIGDSFNSIDDEKDYFTNFVNSSLKKEYKLMSKLYEDIENGYKNIFRRYKTDEIYDNGDVVNRLSSIINYANNNEYTKNYLVNKIYKLKNKENPNIHLYVSLDNKIMKIVLIDLYHLSIPSDLYSKNKLVRRGSLKELKNKYNNCCRYNYNLNTILKKELQLQ